MVANKLNVYKQMKETIQINVYCFFCIVVPIALPLQ